MSHNSVKYKVHISRHREGERGESLPGILMAVAISAVAAAGVISSISNVFQANKSVQGSQSMNKFQDSIRGSVSNLIRYFAMAGCYQTACDPTYGDDTRYQSICTSMGGANANGNNPPKTAAQKYDAVFTSSNLPLPVLNASLSFVTGVVLPSSPFISAEDKSMGQAAARCDTPVMAGTVGAGEYYRFCLKTNTSAGTQLSKDSFWYSNTGNVRVGSTRNEFIEIMAIPVSLPSDTPIKCQDFTKSKQNGFKVLYTQYRYRKVDPNKDSSSDVRQQSGVFYVSGIDEPMPPPALPNVYCAQGPNGFVNIITLDKNEANACMSIANSNSFKAGCEGDPAAKLIVRTCNQLRSDLGWRHQSRIDAARCIRFNPLKCYQGSPKKWNK